MNKEKDCSKKELKNRKNFPYILVFLFLMLAFLIVIYLKFLKKEGPIEWTALNSLKEVLAPLISDDGDIDSLIRSLEIDIGYFQKRENNRSLENEEDDSVMFGKKRVPINKIRESLVDFKSKLVEYGLTEQFFQYIRDNYQFYQSAVRNDVLFTGYFEIDLKGSLSPSEVNSYPIYKKPDDLYRIKLSEFSFFKKNKEIPLELRGRVTNDAYGNYQIVPYYTREEIDYQKKLSARGLEIAWVDNPIDVFFLHIQGSGIIHLDDGKFLRVNYAEKNGHPYRSIGKWLIQRGKIIRENISMQRIEKYLENHPEERQEIFCYNPSYVFFRVIKEEEGPLGAIGVPLTAFRSIAMDRYLFPKGALCYIQTQLPRFDSRGDLDKLQSYSCFVMNQDTGGAICGPGRVDLFTGHGKQSRLIAGYMKFKGTFYFLLKK